jgi:superfamily II DNA/RNA helicase
MDAFKVHRDLIDDYRRFTEGFVEVQDRRLRDRLEDESARGAQWPDPWLSLNPSFESGGSVDELVAEGILHETCSDVFRFKRGERDRGEQPLVFHRHQREAIEVASTRKSYVLTTGTGSGKSLAYIVPIVDRVLREGSGNGVKAIVVYPMNALANSQMEELKKFLHFGFDGRPPVTFRRYTGQESQEDREEILRNPPDIILTNYVMLELLLTRPDERASLVKAAQGLQFLVLDELHTYRGRQGADVGMLVRRVRQACKATDTLQCVGTSATMSSGGTLADQRRDVAEVASRIFGTDVTPDAVITESLVRATPETAPDPDQLSEIVRVRGDIEAPALSLSAAELTEDALASWIETEFGVQRESANGPLVRRPPQTVEAASHVLSELAGRDAERCGNAIRSTLLAGSRTKNATGRSFFAFRLHQFLSKGGTVYTTAESVTDRAIETVFQLVLPGDTERRLYPLAFCRECGQEYLMVHREDGYALARHQLRVTEQGDGYLYLSDDLPWPANPIADGRLPASWLMIGAAGVTVTRTREKDVPERVSVHPNGAVTPLGDDDVPEGETLAAWIPGIFRFCLNCGVSYEAPRTSEYTKLVTLDREGRSSAMTVLATSLIASLKQLPEGELDPQARKLLTFVDNRQDASLQAGHLNDFVQVVQLRGALFRALRQNPHGIDLLDIGQAVSDALELEPVEFLAAPDGLGVRQGERALRNVLEFRAIADLQRGWRLTLPNLEQTGLMTVEYPEAIELASLEDRWADAHSVLRDARPGQREEAMTVMLDEFRRVLAVDSEALSRDAFERLQRESRARLTGLWAIGDLEPAPLVGVARAEPGRQGGARSILTLTGRGAYGKWLANPDRFGVKLTPSEATDVIASMLEVLERAGIVKRVIEEHTSGFRLNSAAVLLLAGDGKTGAPDPVRRRFDNEQRPRVVEYFRDLYDQHARELAGIRAAEHTAQVPADIRIDREKAFTSAQLPLLFCSPTMELGVDIAALNAVAMRNVPPTPANYAQRSGRAGRSGQPALVVTYCASGNSHDSYYFERSHLMVAGQVQPPRLDLANEDLVRSHVHAIWLAEALAPTRHGLGSSMRDVLDVESDHSELHVRETLWEHLGSADAATRAREAAAAVLAPLEGLLSAGSWWDDGWMDTVISNARNAFDRACDRWRQLYISARNEQDAAYRQTKNVSSSRREREDAERRQREARQRIDLLLNDAAGSGFNQSDFYTYRYLASEGFLPGYSFPRLPLAAFIPGWGARESSWLQRPRFLAISEFGPNSLIYHEGARYQVTRISLPREGGDAVGDVTLTEAKVCGNCGTHHLEGKAFDVCESCGSTLPPSWQRLLQLQTVITRRRERISSDEEERNRIGYELRTTYRFVPRAGHPGKAISNVADAAGEPLLEVVYGDAAEIRITNLGRRNRKNPDQFGFWLDTVRGKWLSEKDAQAPDAESDEDENETLRPEDVNTKSLVTPYVEDRRNIIILRWAQPLDEIQTVTAQYALERGIEARFQLEDSELASELLPDGEERGRLLLTEAAEGGAGALRRLQADRDALAEAAREALRIMHVNVETGRDESDSCVRGCYRCLLSYSNQTRHEQIDRRTVIALFRRLAEGTATSLDPETQTPTPIRLLPPVDGDSPAIDPSPSRDLTDEDLLGDRARSFLAVLRERGLRLPERLGDEVGGFVVDFVYNNPRAVVVVYDGDPQNDVAELGWDGWHVVTIGVDEDFDSVIKANATVFGKDVA